MLFTLYIISNAQLNDVFIFFYNLKFGDSGVNLSSENVAQKKKFENNWSIESNLLTITSSISAQTPFYTIDRN